MKFLINFVFQSIHLQTDNGEFFLENYRNVRYRPITEIFPIENYIFFMDLKDWEYFIEHKDRGFDFIGERVLGDIKKEKAKIVIVHPYEGIFGPSDFLILDKWCKEKDLTKDQVYLIHGNLMDVIGEYDFTYIPISYFLCNIKIKENILNFNPCNDKNLFLCYNRNARLHRSLLVCELIKHNLFDRGIISFKGNTQENIIDVMKNNNRFDLVEQALILQSVIPLELEYDLAKENPIFELTDIHHESTFLSLVTETLVEGEVKYRFLPDISNYSPIFFSEKTWKPIVAGQPFIILGTKGMLRALKEIGYKTFDRWWNEDYDDETDTDVKIKKIISILNQLSRLSIEELINLRKEMIPILEHNQKLHNQIRNDLYKNQKQEILYKEIKKIWDTF